MPANTKAIKRRIKSVKNTKKITKAMELVAAAKMRKAIEAALNTRHYATVAWDLLVNLSKSEKEHEFFPLLDTRPVRKLLVILVTSNRGLCGSFNSNIIKKIAKELQNPNNIAIQRIGEKIIGAVNGVEIDIIGVGKKGAEFAKKTGYSLIASFSDFSDTPTLIDSLSISKMAIDAYKEKKYDKIVVAFTDFKSTILQIAKLRQVLPVSEVDLEKMNLNAGREQAENKKLSTKSDNFPAKEITDSKKEDYLFEPDKTKVLNTILPRLVESQIYQALLESAASEHSSRMLAMKSASEAAEEMVGDLTLSLNKARQAAITQEISEIVGGAAALG